ncbi:MAG: hypothetical protein PVG51_18405 [Desulfosarcina sp.]
MWYDLAIIDKTFLFQDSLKINLSYFFELLLRRQQALHQADPFLIDRQGKLDESILAIRLIIGKAVALSIGTTFPRIGVVSTEAPSWALALMTTSAAMSNIAMTKLINILSLIIFTSNWIRLQMFGSF